ncbi:hypothetical protein [Halalkalibacterium ligniniphilum]|uniref:hypothetical protein n=1 Tax=Halalkalibacterium ligniniphilum TaxID=1134413 RepID=UPI00034DC011|nr:hypothetical protein [Halalkalibacterium ligniniphilum]
MNAAQARKVTEQNLEKLAETQLNDAIAELSRLIKDAAEKGHSNVRIYVDQFSALRKLGYDKQVVGHFKNLGFGVETANWGATEKVIRVYWD